MPTGGTIRGGRWQPSPAAAGRLRSCSHPLAASTGSGWVDEWRVQPLRKFLTRGNCATASLQCLYVPSVLSWLTGLEPAQDASAALRAVRAELDLMDEAAPRAVRLRRTLRVCPYSSSVDRSTARCGHPLSPHARGTPAAARHTGSLSRTRRQQWAPRASSAEPSTCARACAGRTRPVGLPRIVYAQPSDPVVWWNNSSSGLAWLRRAKPGATLSGRGIHALRHHHQILADLPRRRDRARRARAPP